MHTEHAMIEEMSRQKDRLQVALDKIKIAEAFGDEATLRQKLRHVELIQLQIDALEAEAVRPNYL